MVGLIAAAVIPAAGAAAAIWIDSGAELASVRAERHGVEYMGQTVKLLLALADAQSAAVRGAPPSRADLAKAVAAVDASGLPDDPAPGTGTLWAQIRPQVLALPDTSATGAAAYRAYSQVTDLILRQIAAIDDASGLVQDPRADANHLVDALIVRLPDMAVQTGRYDDQVTLAEQAGRAQPDGTGAAATARVAVLRDRIAVDAQAFLTALNKVFRATGSATLGPHLLGDVDLVNTDVNALAPTASVIDEALVLPSAQTVSQDRKAFDPAVQVLETAGLAELDKLLQAREAGYEDRRVRVAALLGGGAVLAVPSVWWLRRRRDERAAADDETREAGPRTTARIGQRRSGPVARATAEAGAPEREVKRLAAPRIPVAAEPSAPQPERPEAREPREPGEPSPAADGQAPLALSERRLR